MTTLLRLLGTAQLATPGGNTDLPNERASWLIAYLGSREDWVSRQEILEVFWPDADEPAARNNLRQLLHRIRKLGWADGLEANTQGVRWTQDTDVRLFRRAFARADWAEAARQHRGPFLANLRVYDLPALEAWLEDERADLQAAWRDAALGYAGNLERIGATQDALPILEELLGFDPYGEGALVAFVRAAMVTGQHERARNTFEMYRRRTREELGLEPEPTTVRLIESLLEQKTEPTPNQKTRQATQTPINLPARRTAFVGREEELALIASQLSDATCRLLTVVGPGGAGKTRFALQAAEAEWQTHPDGVFFVALAPHGPNEIPAAIAEAVGLILSGSTAPAEQVLQHLGSRQMLLVLDNFEHLLDGTGFVHDLLARAPRVRLLVTSRIPLGLSEERIMPLEGLPYPASPDLATMRRSSAVRLFVEHAARLRAGFALGPEVAPGVARICTLVEGLPLGLELAAAWVGTLSPQAIADGIEECLDFLVQDSTDRPERHRSLRAVFEHSWALLADDEQRALSRLSVFRGGFERRAANLAAGVNPRMLVTLVGKSLVRSATSGRFELLEVIRQNAAEKLDSTETHQVRAVHARYFTALAEETAPKLLGPSQAEWLSRLEVDHGNVRAALGYSLEFNPELGLRLATALQRFWGTRGHLLEGHGWFQHLRSHPDILTIPDQVRGRAAYTAGSLARTLGRLIEAQTLLEEGLGLAQATTDRALEGDVLFELGIVHRSRGRYELASDVTQAALQIQRQEGDRWGEAQSLNGLGIIHALQADKPEASRLWTQSLEIAREVGDRNSEAGTLENLGLVTNDIQKAKKLFEQSLQIKREIGNRGGMAHTLTNLGGIALDAGDATTAIKLLGEALETFAKLGQDVKAAHVLAMLAQVEAMVGRHERALSFAVVVHAVHQQHDARAVPEVLANLERLEQTARNALGVGATQQALEAGRVMGLKEAVRQALEPGETKVPAQIGTKTNAD
jgi:predicted ATPase/DNA-binding SARP family transcriptional activator/Tfp pilus assembly protein PilF